MNSNSLHKSFIIFFCLFLFLFGFIAAEVSYRAYLFYHLNVIINKTYEDQSDNSFRALSFPALQTYHQEYGFEYFTGTSVSVDIKAGKFSSCSYGNYKSWSKDAINPDHQKYPDADIKILLLGSSHSATSDKNGELASVSASRSLSSRLGQAVQIQNLSRGSYGFLSMTDLAKAKIQEYQPDLIVFAINTSDLARPRWWPIYVPEGNGFYLFYQSRTPYIEQLTQENALLHQYIYSDQLTREWCDKLSSAHRNGNDEIFQKDAYAQSLIKFANYHKQLRQIPTVDLDLWILSSSFLINKMRFDDPFYGEDVYRDGNPIGPIGINNFLHDKQFANAWEGIKSSEIPTYIIHIPNPFEIKKNIEFLGGYGGMPKYKIDRLVASIPQFYDQEVLSLLSYYSAPATDTSKFVMSDDNWHPNAIGTAIIAAGLEEHIFNLLVKNKIVQPPVEVQ